MAAKPTSAGNSRRLRGLNPAALMAQGLGARDEAGADRALPELPGYELLGRLGEGGMGEVFRARQLSLDREVAVKLVRRERLTEEWFVERLEREARLLARLRHPHLVTVHDFLRLPAGAAAVVMELIEGGSLRDRLRAAPGGLPFDEVRRLGREIAAALAAAHAAGVVHRDVKPENVLLDAAGRARVGDFGMALPLSAGAARYTRTGAATGTPGYLAPEQLTGGPTDQRGDLYAFGVLLYEMLTGRLPLGHFTPPRELRPEVPAAVEALLLRSLRPDPADRPADLRAWLELLAAPDAATPRRRFSRRRAVFGGVAAGLAAGGLWFWRPRRVPADGWQTLAWPDDLAAATISGNWRREGGALVSDDLICLLALAPEMPAAYDLKLTFRRLGGQESAGLFFRHASGYGSCELDGWSRHAAGIQAIGGRAFQTEGGFEFTLVPGEDHELGLELRPDLARVSVDGGLRGVYTLGEPLSVTTPWAWTPGPASPALALGSWQSPIRFHSLRWRDRTAG